jgi:hypothetical protein
MSEECSGGTTHHMGCECWEWRRNDRLARLEAENRALREALAPFRALASAYPHEVDGWLVTHTEPGLTLGDVRRLVGEGRE